MSVAIVRHLLILTLIVVHTTKTMENITQCQLVLGSISELQDFLSGIQANASNSGFALHSIPDIHTCYDRFQTSITSLRGEISKEARETANFVLGNIFSSLLKESVSNDAKKLMIDKFFYAPDPDRPSLIGNKIRKVNNLRMEMEHQRSIMELSQHFVEEIGYNPLVIHNDFEIIIVEIQTIRDLYDRICQKLEELRGRLDTVNIAVEDLRAETEWLATVSTDLRTLSNTHT